MTLSAIYNTEDTTTIIASDYYYNVKSQTVNKDHYIRNQSEDDEKNLALGFDMSGIDLTGKEVNLVLTKTGYSAYSSTSVNVINSNPWANETFDYADASAASEDAVTKEDGNSNQFYGCKFTLDKSKLTKVGDKIYLNVERKDMDSKQNGNDYFLIYSAKTDAGKKAILADYLPKLAITAEPAPTPRPAPTKEQGNHGKCT